jgi:hypothetical protein
MAGGKGSTQIANRGAIFSSRDPENLSQIIIEHDSIDRAGHSQQRNEYRIQPQSINHRAASNPRGVCLLLEQEALSRHRFSFSCALLRVPAESSPAQMANDRPARVQMSRGFVEPNRAARDTWP